MKNNRKLLFLVFGVLICVFTIDTYMEELVLNKMMKTALKKFNPQFDVWETSDYSLTIQKAAVENNRNPYYLLVDVNEDQKDDLILDGHDNKNNLLICLLSTPKGYDVVVIRKIYLAIPKELDVYNDGIKEMGLNYFLWPNHIRTGFTLAYPQHSDSEGNLLVDGAMIDYVFKDGKFHESYQTL
jgi:hypothetical protein